MSILDRVVVAAPCPVSWDSMEGDERVRHCAICVRSVYNISDMSDQDAERFFEENGTTQCVRFFRRSDGKLMTDNCPVGLRAIRNRIRLIVGVAASFLATFVSILPNARAQEPTKQTVPSPKRPRPASWLEQLPLVKPSQNFSEAAGGIRAMPPPDSPANQSKPPKQVLIGPDECPGNPKPEIRYEMGRMKAPVKKDDNSLQGDTRAFDLYQKAKSSETAGNLLLAQTQYLSAIEIMKMQPHSDPLFMASMVSDLNGVRSKLGFPPLDGKTLRPAKAEK